MKIFKTLILTIAITLSGMTAANAQKVAHINVQELIAIMPGTIALQGAMKSLQETYTKDINTAGENLQNKQKKYEGEVKTVSAIENEKRGRELQQDQAKVQSLVKTAQEELQKKEYEGLNPILEKAQNAIAKVAKDNGYSYILDSSPGKGVIIAEGTDIISLVKKELGIN
ncbi:MAG: OmpH family outer membrane protein [Flavobacteriaceae bacterium]|nr:OmpH family outer membrane protein [Flavobacteriaceae bacterium]